MKKVLVAVLVMLFWCNVVQAKIILSKCYIAKWKYESKDKPEMIQKKFDDKKFSDLFYEQLESTSKKLSTFSKKIGKDIEDLEIDDLVLLVEQS